MNSKSTEWSDQYQIRKQFDCVPWDWQNFAYEMI